MVTAATRTVASIVGGAPVDGAAGGMLAVANPGRLHEPVAHAALGDAATFVDACRAAREAQPAWAGVPAPVRGRAIQQLGRLVEDNLETLAQLITREIGKPIAEARGEVREVVDTCTFFLGEGRRLYGQTVPSEMPDKQLFTFRTPIGVAAIVTAGNFPVAVPSWYLVPALLCGNAVVWKPAEYAPATSEAFAQLILHAGFPDGTCNLVLADGVQTFGGLERALDEGLVDKVGFTGSTEVGRRIGALCGANLQSPCLELGGKNPLVVMPDADLDLAVEGALFSGFATAGQRCTSLGTAIVHRSVHDEFVRRFDEATRAAAIGDPTRAVLYGPMMSERFLERFLGWLDLIRPHHRTHGSSSTGRITAEHPRDGFVGDPEAGLYCHPTIVTGVTIDDDLYRTETFGPIVGVAGFHHFDEAIELANGHGYGLSSSIYTTEPLHAFRFRERISAGMVSVNNSTSGAEAHLPFGGNGRSGNGSRQSGIWVLDQFTRWQAVNWDYSGRLQRAQIDVADVAADLSFRLPAERYSDGVAVDEAAAGEGVAMDEGAGDGAPPVSVPAPPPDARAS
jgi:aldehyde dehydrogenase (NAD+)